MYTNPDNIFKLPDPTMLTLLLILKHAPNRDMSEQIATLIRDDVAVNLLEEKGYIKYNKGKKGECELSRMRLTPKGTKYLNSLQDPEVTVNDKKMFSYLCDMYLSHEDEERHIGNKKKTLEYCTEFRVLMDLSIHQMYWLCWFFLKEHSYTKKLEYIFLRYRKGEPYRTFRGSLHDSDLYQFFDSRKTEVKQLWKKKGV